MTRPSPGPGGPFDPDFVDIEAIDRKLFDLKPRARKKTAS
jgi:hypothetical protein